MNFMINEETLLLFHEVNFMSILNHPSFLKFIGYYPINFDDDPYPTIITELAANGSLRDIIKMETAGLSPDEWNFTKKKNLLLSTELHQVCHICIHIILFIET